MNNQSIARVLASYNRLVPHIDDMVAGFYARLFAAAPEARALFKHDMANQRQHLAATLALLVRNLTFKDVLVEPLMELGMQHVIFGARPEQYPIVRNALLASIAEFLGEHWTAELADDWRAVLDYVVASMLKGATLYALDASRRASQKTEQTS